MEAEASTGAPSTSQQAHSVHSVLGKREAGSDTAHRSERPAAGSGSEARSSEERGDERCCQHKEQLEEARRLLDLAMRELEATRAAAAAQMQLYDARAHSLEEQLRAARAERDAAAARAKTVEESARAQRAAAEPPTPNTTLLFDSRTGTPLQSPHPTAQIAHQLADVRQQLEQIRQQRGYPGAYPPGNSSGQPAIPSRSGDPSRGTSGLLSPLPNSVYRVGSSVPGDFSLPSLAPESISTATQYPPNPAKVPAALFQPTEPIPRAPLRSVPQFYPPVPVSSQPRPETPSGRPHPPEPPGLTLPRQGELLRTIERAAPLLNILMLGSLGPLPQWKNPPYATARPPPAPAALRNVPTTSIPPVLAETARGTNDPGSPPLRPTLEQPSGAFSPTVVGNQLPRPQSQSPGPQNWHHAQAGEDASGHAGQIVAGQPHPPSRTSAEGGDHPGRTFGQRSRHAQTGTPPLPTTRSMRGPS